MSTRRSYDRAFSRSGGPSSLVGAISPMADRGGVLILVGIGLMVAWLGSSPKPSAPSVPAKILYARLHDVSCVSSSRCVAVGDFLPVDKDAIGGDPDGDGQATHTLVESSVSGAWRRVASPDLGLGGAQLSSVSCPSAADCVAVGFYIPGRFTMQAPSYPLIEAYDGTTWNVVASPSVAPNSVLESVSCPSSSSCTAVGYETTSANQEPEDSFFIEHFDGHSWTVVALTPPIGASTGLNSVSCPSTSSCVAVGDIAPVSDAANTRPLVERLTDGHWSMATLPAFGTETGILYDVTCASADQCVAVGHGGTTNATGTALVLSSNGTTWTTNPAALAQSGDVSLSALGCSDAANCLVAGTSETSGKVVVARVVAGQWDVVGVPSTSDNIEGISCVGSSTCQLVGFSYVNALGNTTTMVASLVGTTWTSGSGQAP